MLDCLIGAFSTGVFAYLTRRRLLAQGLENDDLLALLRTRGFDVEDHAMEAYLEKTYERLGKLGEGNSGSVWKVKQKKNGEHYAMKCIRKKKGRVAEKGLETEIKCLRKLQHRHIVNIVDSVESNHQLWIIMECADGGGLYERIVQLRHFSERSASRIVKQVLKAVHYMHSYGVVHRDLKPENILLMSAAEDSEIKVADFGLAVVLRHGLQGNRIDESMRLKAATDITEGFCGSPICMAPEVASRNAAYGPQCDIWSVGCITFELLNGSPPFTAPSVPELFHLIHISTGPSFSDWIWLHVSANAKDLVTNMLKRYPEDRFSAREALQHPWFRTAPDNHNALAQDSIIRRLTTRTTRTSFATTATFLGVDSRPGSRRPSRAPSLAGMDVAALAPPQGSLLCRAASLARDAGTREDDSTAESLRDSVPLKAPMLNVPTIHVIPPQKVVDAEPKDDEVEGKFFQIARGGLQRAAWTEGDVKRKTHM